MTTTPSLRRVHASLPSLNSGSGSGAGRSASGSRIGESSGTGTSHHHAHEPAQTQGRSNVHATGPGAVHGGSSNSRAKTMLQSHDGGSTSHHASNHMTTTPARHAGSGSGRDGLHGATSTSHLAAHAKAQATMNTAHGGNPPLAHTTSRAQLQPSAAPMARASSHAHPTMSLVESLMRESADGIDVSHRLPELRRAILTDGVSADETGMSSHRIYTWLILLRAPVMDYDSYAALLKRGASPAYAKINDDTHRTLATDPLFARRVSQNSLARLLNTIAWRLDDENRAAAAAAAAAVEQEREPGKEADNVTPSAHEPVAAHPSTGAEIGADPSTSTPSTNPNTAASASVSASATITITTTSNTSTATTTSTTIPPSSTQTGAQLTHPPAPASALRSGSAPTHTSTPGPRTASTQPSPYVQGMNVLLAPALYCSRSEPQAFALLHTLLTRHMPAYVTPTLAGVHAGVALVDRLLATLDPALAAFLSARNLPASVYAFPAVLTLSACSPPLPEVLVLWDFLLAWGVHLNVLAVVAQVVLMRDRVLRSDSPARDLRSLGPLRARAVIDLVLVFVGRIQPPDRAGKAGKEATAKNGTGAHTASRDPAAVSNAMSADGSESDSQARARRELWLEVCSHTGGGST